MSSCHCLHHLAGSAKDSQLTTCTHEAGIVALPDESQIDLNVGHMVPHEKP